MNGPPPIWTTGSTEVFKTGSWRAALPQHIRAPSPCHAACPVNGDIAEWIGLARARDFRGAWEVLTRHNPFPAIAGRICHHPCEAACNRAGFDESLAICKLERFVGDLALAEGWSFAPPTEERSERIAVVGGGPSGLSAAYQLRRRGYGVALFESQPALGGLMRYGIPPYRLARSILDGEIARIVALGVEVHCGEPLATAADLERLRGGHDALYLATGARRQKRLPQLDYTQPWVMDGAEYLARASTGNTPALGRRMVVIGGGSAALDVARSARRAGHEVTIVALESVAQMPAQREEINEALEEGIVLVAGAMLTGVTPLPSREGLPPMTPPPLREGLPPITPLPLRERGRGEGAVRIDLVRVRFEPGAQRGQFTVTPRPDSEFALIADAVVPSIGQDPDLAPLGSLAAEGGLLKVDTRLATSAAGVYAGGDLASMARFVTEAVGMGKRAAAAIDRALRGGAEAAPEDEPVVKLASIATAYYPRQARAAEQRLDARERVKGDAEVQLGLELERALAESERCFSCGTCVFCDNCVNYCPDLAVKRDVDGYVVLTDYCKGCGLCVKECPTGSMKMLEEAR
jgi:NADPH-dependent glutamate synthase beta subunit-like oxidoreductase/Pyruvate/2-oxoacid:ferredoxin oxidoreductase delta subunit